MKKHVTALILLWVVLIPAAAWANSVSAGPGAIGNSWYAPLLANNSGTGSSWTMLEAYIVPGVGGVTFENPAIHGQLNDPSWQATFINGNWMTISGPARTSDLLFTLAFNSSITTPVTVEFFQFLNGQLLTGETTVGVWNGSSWTFYQDPSLTPVPEPSSMLLVGTSLLLLGGFVRRKLKN